MRSRGEYFLAVLSFVFFPVLIYFLECFFGLYQLAYLFYVGYPLLFLFYCYYKTKKTHIYFDLPFVLLVMMLIPLLLLFPNFHNLFYLVSLAFGYIGMLTATKKKKIVLKKNKNIKSFVKNYESLVWVIPGLVVIVLEMYYRVCTFSTVLGEISILSMFFGILLIYFLYFIFLSIFGNHFPPTLLLATFLFIFFCSNQMRIFYTTDVLIMDDFLFLSNAGEISGFLDVTFINAFFLLLVPNIIAILLLLWLCFLSYYNNLHIPGSIRWSLGIASLAVVSFLMIPFKVKDEFFIDTLFEMEGKRYYSFDVSNTKYYRYFGVISGFYGKFLNSHLYLPNGFDRFELIATLRNAPVDDETVLGKPNIIVIFSESFWDISQLGNITFDKDVTPNFHTLQEKGKLVNMISPSYGGVSGNVEFEVLTGGSLNYYTKGFVAYMRLYQQEDSYFNPSVIWELRNNGYQTNILNSSSSGMFNCSNVYDKMRVNYTKHYFDELSYYVTDSYLTDEIISRFEQTEKPSFILGITMGGHMPYYGEKYEDYDLSIVKGSGDEELDGVLLSYAQGIHNADKELKRLYDYIMTKEEDTILVFFGDHLPHLQTSSGKDGLDILGYFDTDNDLENLYRRYNTQAIILTNYDVEYEMESYLSPDLLLVSLLGKMKLSSSEYFRWLYSTRLILPSSNSIVSQDKKGKLHYTKALIGEMEYIYDMREKMQYFLYK